MEGVHRFLARVWRLMVGSPDPSTGRYREQGVVLREEEPTEEQLRALHQCIRKVGREGG